MKNTTGNPANAIFPIVFIMASLLSLAGDTLFGNSAAANLSCLNECTVWNQTTLTGDDSRDEQAIEVGLKFRSDVLGQVSGVRFYKEEANVGPHTGNLWKTDGTNIGSVMFTEETDSGWQEARFPAPIEIEANTTYIVSYHTTSGHYAWSQGYFAEREVASSPLVALQDGVDGPNGVYAYGTRSSFPSQSGGSHNYWVDVVFDVWHPSESVDTGNASGASDLASNSLATDFTRQPASALPAFAQDQGPGGPILVLATNNDPFTYFYGEVLRTEGLTEFAIADVATLSTPLLSGYDVVVLGTTSLSADQVSILTDWVTAGGNLIAVRPDKQLGGLLGLSDAGSTLSNAYLLVDTSKEPGAGIVGETMQFHATADLYALNGAISVATLYSNASTPTGYPAVTLINVGASGGQAAAFTYDLARSLVYTRQGNPIWAGDERDGSLPVRPNDMFYGAKTGDIQSDWIDLTKVAIPQADEQQRLLANLILTMNRDQKPLPRFWYFPWGKQAVVILTGDEHGGGDIPARLEAYKAASPAGCSVEDWECVRSSVYAYASTSLTDAAATIYDAEDFEIAAHINTGCVNYTPTSLSTNYSQQLSAWRLKYPGLPAQTSHRMHCVAWSDWATQARVDVAHGIRLDTTYYYFPSPWVQNRPGLFTGSGMPMRFADLDGTLIDVYQAATQMTDESGQTYPFTIDTLLDRALGPEGFYGAFVANMHYDYLGAQHRGANAIIASSQARGVPIVTSRQMLTWLDGRNSSTFGSLLWNSDTLSFTITPGPGARGLQAMVPIHTQSTSLTGLTIDGVQIPYQRLTIKGIDYALFAASLGAYQATYDLDTSPPLIANVTAMPVAADSATITWTTDEPANSVVEYGVSPDALSSSMINTASVTSHLITLGGLSSATDYYYRVTSFDAFGNGATWPPTEQSTAVLTMPSPTPTPTPTSTPVLGYIFADGFERGDLTAWSSSATDAGDLTVSGEAALVGSYGLQATIDDTAQLFVRDDSPALETRYHASFWFDPNSITMANNDSHIILNGFSGSPSSVSVVQVHLRFYGGQYQLQGRLITDGASYPSTAWFALSDAPHLIELDWRAATAPGSNDGGLTLWLDGVQQASLSGVDNDTRRIDHMRLGAVNGIDPGTRGVYTFDAFESSRVGTAQAPTSTPTPTMTATPSAMLEPTPTPTNILEPSPTPTNTLEPTPTDTVEPTPTPTNTLEPTPTDTVEPTPTPTNTLEPTPTDTVEPTPTPTNTLEPTPTDTVEPTPTPTNTLEPTPTNTPEPSSIFADGFERGDLTAWSSSATDSGDLTVSGAAALVGSYGLQATIDDTAPLFVRDDSPALETRYHASFWFDPNSIIMANNDSHIILSGFSAGPGSVGVVQMTLRFSNNQYQLQARLVNDSTSYASTAWFTLSDAPHLIELDWRAATAPGNNDGGLTLWLDGVQQASLSGVDNDTRRIDHVRLGAVNGIDPGTRGVYTFDQFESAR
jgi:hypothetical protein